MSFRSLLWMLVFVARASQAATFNVNVGSNFFNSSSFTVTVGDTVQWNLVGGCHNVSGPPSSPAAPGGCESWPYSFTFNSAGSFPYVCGIHSGMAGVVNVAPATTQTSTTTPTTTPTITASPTDVPPGSTFTNTSTISATSTPSPTSTATPTVSPTRTPGSPVIQIFDKAPELLLAPNPLKIGDSVCLFSDLTPTESHWDIYNTNLESVARLNFQGAAQQCWATKAAAPGLYYVHVKWVLPDGRIKRSKQKVVLWR